MEPSESTLDTLKTMRKRYSDLLLLPTFEERFEYLKCNQPIGEITFGGGRYLNQALYSSPEWKELRSRIIVRDNGCDLGVEGYPIVGKMLIHHINPITKEEVLRRAPSVFDPENLILVSYNTHQDIHYREESRVPTLVVRKPNDTCPWR